MSRPDYVPSADALFNKWQNVFMTYLLPKSSDWGITGSLLQPLATLKTNWEAKFAAVENPETKTSVAVRAKNDARKTYEKALREFIKSYLMYNPLVTDADRVSLEIPVHNTARTPVPVPVTMPYVHNVDRNTIRRLSIYFRDSEKEGRGKPQGVIGVVVRWCVAAERPNDINDMNRTALDTRSPFTMEFDENERGKTVYYALTWQNTKGETGPWSEILNAIVP